MNVLERSARRLDDFQQRHTVPSFLFAVMKKYGDDNGGAIAAQVTYTIFITVFPLLLLLVTLLGILLAHDPGLRQSVLNSTLRQFPIVGGEIGKNIHALRRSSVVGLAVGIAGLAYGSTGLAGAGLYAMSQVWNIPNSGRPGFINRLERSVVFLLILLIGVTLTTALSAFGTFGKHNVVLGALSELLAAVTNVGLYLGGFRVLTPKIIATRRLVPGAVAGGVLWTVLQAVGGYVVGHDLRGASAVYGLFAVVLGLTAWIYLGTEITLYVAEMNTVLAHRLWPRAMVQPPLTVADQRAMALQVAQTQRRPDQVVETSFSDEPMTEREYGRAGGQVRRAAVPRTPAKDIEETPT